MAFTLKLPRRLARQWAVKIRDKERLEPPHVTVIRGTRSWRVELRTGEFMDEEPDPAEVAPEVMQVIQEHWDDLQQQWDAMYPENPVRGEDENSDD